MTKEKEKNNKLEAPLIDKKKEYSIDSAIDLMKKSARAKFDESTEVSVILGIKPDKADHLVRGSIVLPYQKEDKKIRIVAFAKGDQAEIAKKAGADYVGSDDLIEKIMKEKWTDFDYSVATPDLMVAVGKVAKILGPLGLLPNKKNNTVALDLGPIIKELKSGLMFFKNDSNGNINFNFGKVSFSEEKLIANIKEFFKSLTQAKPNGFRGIFIKKAVISSTMGPGIKLEINSLLAR